MYRAAILGRNTRRHLVEASSMISRRRLKRQISFKYNASRASARRSSTVIAADRDLVRTAASCRSRHRLKTNDGDEMLLRAEALNIVTKAKAHRLWRHRRKFTSTTFAF